MKTMRLTDYSKESGISEKELRSYARTMNQNSIYKQNPEKANSPYIVIVETFEREYFGRKSRATKANNARWR